MHEYSANRLIITKIRHILKKNTKLDTVETSLEFEY